MGASNELKYADDALKYGEALMISQPFSLNARKSIQRFLEGHGTPFLIDPETYRYFLPHKYHFKGSNKDKKIRAWLDRMSNLFPEEIRETFGKRAARVENFDALQLLEFCQSNIEIQTAMEKEDGTPLLPNGIVAPYLRLTNEKMASNLLFQTQVISTTVKVNKSSLPVVGVFYFSKDILTNNYALRQIRQAMKEVECENIAVWVDNFDEKNATEEELYSLNDLYLELSKTKHVLSMYGGMAQIMMMFNGLGSITHGIHYQLHKNGLSNGGVPAYYFYLPNLFQRVRTIEASAIIKRQGFSTQQYLKKSCNCQVCEEILSIQAAERIFNLEGNESDIVKILTNHFAFNKSLEIANVFKLTKEQYADWVLEKIQNLHLTIDEREYADLVINWVSVVLDIDLIKQS